MKGDDLAERLLQFAVQVTQLLPKLVDRPGSDDVERQLVRVGLGPGAHYQRARCAESRADSVLELSRAANELREAVYWLRLGHGARLFIVDVSALVHEGTELTALLTACSLTACAE